MYTVRGPVSTNLAYQLTIPSPTYKMFFCIRRMYSSDKDIQKLGLYNDNENN